MLTPGTGVETKQCATLRAGGAADERTMRLQCVRIRVQWRRAFARGTDHGSSRGLHVWLFASAVVAVGWWWLYDGTRRLRRRMRDGCVGAQLGKPWSWHCLERQQLLRLLACCLRRRSGKRPS